MRAYSDFTRSRTSSTGSRRQNARSSSGRSLTEIKTYVDPQGSKRVGITMNVADMDA